MHLSGENFYCERIGMNIFIYLFSFILYKIINRQIIMLKPLNAFKSCTDFTIQGTAIHMD